ncbi:alpha/beta hydrolase family esterase [Rubrivivax sp. RP6-9]|uniref:extracellular catalytic domain type 1 short-chain-length polyhydroxyalkanoate depolymerase n=1 Tax=Rubrivivax sp. RP6-9 TaxID=3415750 RepID=UPI003CC601A7
MHDVTETIRRALAAGHLAAPGPGSGHDAVVDVDVRFVPAGDDGNAATPCPPPGGTQRPRRLESRTFSNAFGTRAYKVHVPAAPAEAPRAMVVMLHGCTQSADDFAAGTQMNRLADAHGFLVVYPEQPAHANASKCWNWFRPQDQARDAGEPALVAGIVREVAQQHGVDPRRIFVAGLSAGAAMAVVLGETYPELFAGVGAHSGLPFGSAHDIPSALAAMKGGRGQPGPARVPGDAAGARRTGGQAVPVIVFHGDRDHTVQQTNGQAIVRQAQEAHARDAGGGLHVTTQAGLAPGGRRFSRAVHTDALGRVRIEHWTLHGGGHAWSGGHASGSYTDGTGPDASAEMVRFFLALPHDGAA